MAVSQLNNVIKRSNVIGGAVDDDYRVAPLQAAAAGSVFLYSVTLSREQVQGLGQTPVAVTPVPGQGKRIEVLGAHLWKTAGGYSPAHTVVVLYGGTEGQEAARFPTSWLRDPLETGGWGDITPPEVAPDQVDRPVDQPLVVTSANRAAGDGGDVTITVRYVEVA